MEKERPVLSISVLVSNGQKNTIRKCMESLTNLRRSVPCELVIVDTGCTDGTIDIAAEYADKLVKFPWCNDFSAARNAGLFQCTGKWFLHLDDDEWFENTKEIENFFTTGEYQYYDSGWYVARNYHDMSGEKFSDCYTGRMCLLTPQTRFNGKIHEWLEPFAKNIKKFNCYVHHYGYVFIDEEEKQKHFFRNLLLEEQEVREHPDDIRMCCQLIQEYRSVQSYELAEKLCKETLQKCKLPKSVAFVQYLITCIPRIYGERGQYLDAYEEYLRIEKEETLCELARILCMYERTLLLEVLNRDQEMIAAAKQYILAVENRKEQSFDYPVMDFASFASTSFYSRVLELAIRVIYRSKLFTDMEFFFSRVNWNEQSSIRNEMVLLFLQCCFLTSDRKSLTTIAPRFLSISELKEVFQAGIEDLLIKNPKDTVKILEAIEELGREDELFGFLHLRLCYERQESLSEALKVCFKDTKRRHDDEIVSLLLTDARYIALITEAVDFDAFKEGVDIRFNGRSIDELTTLQELMNKEEGCFTEEKRVYFLYAVMKLKEAVLVEIVQHGEAAFYMDTIEKLIAITEEYCTKRYCPNMRLMDFKYLPKNCRFAYLLKYAFFEPASFEVTAEYAKEATRLFPKFSPIVKYLLDETLIKNPKTDLKADSTRKELEKLGEQMKEVVSSVIDKGDYRTASKLLSEVAALLPRTAWVKEYQRKLTENS